MASEGSDFFKASPSKEGKSFCWGNLPAILKRRLELGIADRAVVFHLDLQLDHVAAARFTDDGRPDLRVVLVERADVARIVEVVMHCLMVCTDLGDRYAESGQT